MKRSFAAPGAKKLARLILAMLFIAGSVFHFVASEVELQLIPPFLPWRRAALSITGVFELLGGVGLLIPRFQRRAGQGLAVLLVAIFPANVYHTLTRKRFHGLTRSPLYHIVRWPMQGILIWWAWWCSREEETL